MCIRCSVCEQKDEQKEQSEQYPSNSNVRRFQSNQSISDINIIHTDRVIESFDRRNQNIDEKTKSVNLH